MHWMYLLAAVACFLLAMARFMPTWGVLLCLAGALGFAVAWLLGWMASRVAGASRDISHIMSADDLRRLREQADRRRVNAERPPGDDA